MSSDKEIVPDSVQNCWVFPALVLILFINSGCWLLSFYSSLVLLTIFSNSAIFRLPYLASFFSRKCNLSLRTSVNHTTFFVQAWYLLYWLICWKFQHYRPGKEGSSASVIEGQFETAMKVAKTARKRVRRLDGLEKGILLFHVVQWCFSSWLEGDQEKEDVSGAAAGDWDGIIKYGREHNIVCQHFGKQCVVCWTHDKIELYVKDVKSCGSTKQALSKATSLWIPVNMELCLHSLLSWWRAHECSWCSLHTTTKLICL